jgi:uncharacterized membrane protein
VVGLLAKYIGFRISDISRKFPFKRKQEIYMTATVIDRQTQAAAKPASRLFAPDALRGLIMLLMALNHANMFVAQSHSSGEYWGGALPQYPDTASFLARFFTHPAAPGFSFLMGVGMGLSAVALLRRGWSKPQITVSFLIRGFILIVLQFLVVNRAWEINPTGWGVQFYFGVLVALGAGMIISSGLVWLKNQYLLVLVFVLLLVIEMVSPGPEKWGTIFSLPQNVLLVPGGVQPYWVNYPVMQWLELVVLGLVFGSWFADDPRRAMRRSLVFGVVFLVSFLVIRYFNGFGNIRPREGDTWVDFFNLVKYPPSLAFTTLTMGFNLIMLGLFGWFAERSMKVQKQLQPLVVFGRAPLFFYVVHLFLYAALGYLLIPSGTSTVVMLIFWLLGLLLLYPFCRWYGEFRRSRPLNSAWRYF